eukprot:15787-Heterococcus_DN1.PRE.1
MSKRRQELIEQRRQAAIEVKVQRDTIARIMEEAKRNRARAARMLKDAMGGGGRVTSNSATTAVSNGSKVGSKARPATSAADSSSTKQQQGGGTMSKSQSAAVMRRSKSAQSSAVSESGGLGPAPEAPSLEARLKSSSSNTRTELLGAPQAYVSPYEQVMQPPTTVTL